MKIFQSCDWGVRHLEGKRCGSIFWEFERYRFKKEQKSQEETYSEQVASVDDDLLDCVRYGVMAGQPTGGQPVTVESSVSGYKFVDPFTGW
jgi:hypothetical protein